MCFGSSCNWGKILYIQMISFLCVSIMYFFLNTSIYVASILSETHVTLFNMKGCVMPKWILILCQSLYLLHKQTQVNMCTCLSQIILHLPPPQAFRVSRKAGEAGELEARETGDEHARDHGKEKGERRNACENLVDFLAILSFSRHGTFPEIFSLSSDRF